MNLGVSGVITVKILSIAPEQLIESYLDGTNWKLRSEPRNSASTIFKRDKFLRRRGEKDKKAVSGKHKKATDSKKSKKEEGDQE